MDKNKIIRKTLYDLSADVEMILNTDEPNTKIIILNEHNKCTFNMSTYSMISGYNLIKLLEKILDFYKDSLHELTYKNTYYSYGDIINMLFRKLFEQEMSEDEDLYKALDDWYWGEDCEQGDD